MQKIGVIGAGTMGAGIAQLAAQAGCAVILSDQSGNALQQAQSNLRLTCESMFKKGKWTEVQASQIQKNITYSESQELLHDAILVIEAIAENLPAKQALFASLEAIVNDTCLLASNTSSLSITAIAAACKIPERVLGMHFFNPAPVMPLVEIIPALQTQQAAVLKAVEYAEKWGKTTVLSKDHPGFIVNRIARPFYGEALRILEEGIADIATIDWALTALAGFKIGPFALMDLIGNDINYAVTESVFTATYFDSRYQPSIIQKRMVEAGWLGKKSGKGFYDYANNIRPEPHRDEALGKWIVERVVVMLINEAAEALRVQLASASDMEKAMKSGVGYPKGLLAWANEWSIGHCVRLMDELHNNYREERYRCSPLLRQMLANDTAFTGI